VRAALLALLIAGTAADAQAPTRPVRWYKGNTHTHTLNSDGDSPPDVVARWYRDQGYAFVVITDHEKLTDVAPLNAALGAPGTFLVMQGQEVTQILQDSTHPDRRRQAHVNAINSTRVVMPQGGTTIAETYARNLAAIRDAGGLPQVNHPNWRWSVRLSDMSTLPDSTLFELWNGHPGINNRGDGAQSPSTEVLWDALLSRGKTLFGMATDDSHTFQRPWDATMPRPGQAWVMVRADTLTPDAIVGALSRGDFYASTGVKLDRVETGREAIVVAAAGGAGHRFTLVADGAVQASVRGSEARFELAGKPWRYARVVVEDDAGHKAWLQPVYLR